MSTLVLHYGRDVHRVHVDPAGFSNLLLLRLQVVVRGVQRLRARRSEPAAFHQRETATAAAAAAASTSAAPWD